MKITSVIITILNKLKNSNITRLVSGTVLAQIINLVVSPFLSRIYSPAVYGEYSVFLSLTAILSVTSCLRYEYAIMLEKDDHEACNVFILSLSVSLIYSTFISIILVVLHNKLGRFFFIQLNTGIVILIPIYVLLFGLFNSANIWNSRKKRYSLISQNTIQNSLLTNVGQLAFGSIIGPTSFTQSLVYVFSRLASNILFYLKIFNNDIMTIIQNTNLQKIMEKFVQHRKFPLLDTWSSILNILSWQIVPLLLSFNFSNEIVGQYSMSLRIIQLPMSLIGTAIGQVFFQEASSFYASGSNNLHKYLISTIKKLLSFSVFPMIVVGIFGPFLFSIFLGEQWTVAGRFSQILSVWAIVWFMASPISSIFIITNNQRKLLLINIFILLSRLISLTIGGLLSNVYLALWAFSCSGIVAYGYLVFSAILLTKKMECN